MRNPEDLLWERVHASLDAGQNPFDDEALTEDLADAPSICAEVLRLTQRLEVAASPARSRGSVKLRIAAAAAAVILIAIGAQSLWRPSASPPTEPTDVRERTPDDVATSAILSYRITASSDDGSQVTAETISFDVGTSPRRARTAAGRTDPSDGILAYRMHVETP